MVLEEDGAEIEDDDVLEAVVEKTLMALCDGEEWVPSLPCSTPVVKATPQQPENTTKATTAPPTEEVIHIDEPSASYINIGPKGKHNQMKLFALYQ